MEKPVKYEVVIEWSQTDEAHIAEVPEFPGSAADAATAPAALTNVQTVAIDWSETVRDLGRTVPKFQGGLLFARLIEKGGI